MHYLPKIAILSHVNDDFARGGYLLDRMVAAWERKGFSVTVLRGTRDFVPADVLVSHVNLTVVPEEYRAFAQRFPVVINGRATDISKRVVSTHVVHRDEDYAGPVIVKTNRNFGGWPERQLIPARDPLSLARRAAACLLPWSWTGRLRPYDYPIFDSVREVPRAVWRNPLLVVEKFLPERQDGMYCLRQWLFFGDSESSSMLRSPSPIVKSRNVLERERGIPVPDALRALRTKIGFDYGKFDYAM
ncbi:MAG: hypothetical protein H6R26_2087, partial [Proteobacteria bacterium]|nr:hypothetical protein [Pseudomonadota bacterium]